MPPEEPATCLRRRIAPARLCGESQHQPPTRIVTHDVTHDVTRHTFDFGRNEGVRVALTPSHQGRDVKHVRAPRDVLLPRLLVIFQSGLDDLQAITARNGVREVSEPLLRGQVPHGAADAVALCEQRLHNEAPHKASDSRYQAQRPAFDWRRCW